ncbi:MAG: FimB/Mfa2 family fimbrial subunit [Prevotella sp.]
MRRNIHIFLLLSILVGFTLASCEKAMTTNDDDDTPGMENGHSVTFRITVPATEGTEFAEARQHPKEIFRISAPVTEEPMRVASAAFSRITLAIFKDGALVDQVNQSAEKDGFGNINMKLENGTYTAVVLAHSCEGTVNIANDVYKVAMPDNKVTDSFWCNQEFTVGDNTSTVNLSLERIVGKFVLKVLDNIPSKVKTMEFYFTGGSSTLDAVNGVGIVNSRQTVKIPVTSDMVGKPATFEVYTFPRTDSEYLKMKVSALNSSGASLTTKTFEEVPIAKNQVTTYSGSFFGGDPGSGGDTNVSFTITVNTVWDGQIDEAF